VDHIYGLTEAGGTSVLYLSSVPFEQLGFRVLGRDDPYPRLTWEVLSKLPNVVSVGGLMLFGIWWIIQRRQSLATARQDGKMPGKEA
jgi:formate dehydrogenase iron-sulfur subunit